jgi:D-sedoheptulose 7-phosphate isomerase
MNVTSFSDKYINDFKQLLESIEVSAYGQQLDYGAGIEQAVNLVRTVQEAGRKIMMLGNGGSAGITSHMAVDYWKNGKVRATAFNDPSLLTCISNDISFEQVFSSPIEMFADKGDLAFCISSSGSSKNIVNAATQAKNSGCKVITISGFNSDNPLRAMGDINFYTGSFSYGFVENLHQLIIHNILDAKLYCFDKRNIFIRNQPLQD